MISRLDMAMSMKLADMTGAACRDALHAVGGGTVFKTVISAPEGMFPCGRTPPFADSCDATCGSEEVIPHLRVASTPRDATLAG